ncbi:hypothetical protein EVAR_81217_1 [Eumeta japonica]|uniref:Uncharacterized protein n=1 Tax=Eumeta variegata TaxID=151549 RepID=A0A4C1V1K5_EUMVA|nr:hypothetical protein EVAR_81217_1 [Eumeta japonica]
MEEDRARGPPELSFTRRNLTAEAATSHPYSHNGDESVITRAAFKRKVHYNARNSVAVKKASIGRGLAGLLKLEVEKLGGVEERVAMSLSKLEDLNDSVIDTLSEPVFSPIVV